MSIRLSAFVAGVLFSTVFFLGGATCNGVYETTSALPSAPKARCSSS